MMVSDIKNYFKYLIILLILFNANKYKNNQFSKDYYYLNTEKIKKLTVPSYLKFRYDNNIFEFKHYEKIFKNNFLMENTLDLRPPIQILKINNVETILKKTSGYLIFENNDKNIIREILIKIIKRNKIFLLNEKNNIFLTDWIHWNKINKKDKYFGKYIFKIEKNVNNKVILIIQTVRLKNDINDNVTVPLQEERYTTLMFNTLLTEFNFFLNEKNNFSFIDCNI